MRILFQTRSSRSVATSHGGDLVLALATREALLRVGVQVDVTSELEPDLSGYDGVHLFNLVRPQEVWLQARNAVRQKRPVFLSTVYCDPWEYEMHRRGLPGTIARHTNRDVIEALKAGGRAVVSREIHRGVGALLLLGYTRLQMSVVRMTDAFLPNSRSELYRLEQALGVQIPGEQVFVAPNGVDGRFFDTEQMHNQRVPSHLIRYQDCVLCVGRLEGRKNQLTLMHALAGSPVHLVLAGSPAANQPGYVRQLYRASKSANTSILGRVSERDKRWLYRLARVHVLPSWMETTGLSSLEAAAMGCSLVVSDRGDTRDYFREQAEYCSPNDEESIRGAVMRALDRPPDTSLQERVRDMYTWERAAEVTLRAYRAVLE